MLTQEQIRDLLRALAPYSEADLAAATGALQLMPENADQLFRLSVLASVVASIPPSDSTNTMSVHRWREFLNAEPLAETIKRLDDPIGSPFTDVVIFTGGSHTVFPGLNEDIVFVIRHLLRTVFLGDRRTGLSTRFRAFREQARGPASFVLGLSDTIARRAHLARGVEGKGQFWGRIRVPDSARFAELKAAVCFTEAEITALMRRARCSDAFLDRIVLHAGEEPAFLRIGTAESPLFSRPILRSKDSYVVIAPGELLLALRHTIVSLAIENDAITELGEIFSSSVVHGASECLRILAAKPVSTPVLTTLGCWSGLFSFDTDKALHMILLTDTLLSYDSENPSKRWRIPKRQTEAIVRFIGRIEQRVYERSSGLNDILHLVLLQGVGRPFAFQLDQRSRTAYSLPMSAGDLEVIAFLEGGRALALWEFAEARTAIRRTAEVVTTAILDEYEFFRKNRYSYSAGEEAKPTTFIIQPGWEAGARLRVIEERDFHGVTLWNGRAVSEVTLLHSDRAIPVYMRWPIQKDRVAVLVENIPCDIWFLGPEEVPDKRYWGLYTEFADLFSYWAWQCSPSLQSAIEDLAEVFPRIVVYIRLLPSEAWFDSSKAGPDAEVCRWRIVKEGVALELGSNVSESLSGGDNAGERLLITLLCRALRELGERHAVGAIQSSLSDESIETLVELHAPLGLKKKIFFLPQIMNPVLLEPDVPRYRISKHQEARVADEVFEVAKGKLGTDEGIVPIDRQQEVIDEVVAGMYLELQREIQAISPAGLLEMLVAVNERLLYDNAYQQLTIPTRRACFESVGSITEKLDKELPEAATAAVASRFLIEYVAAKPPKGFRPISLDLYGRLIALGAAISYWGQMGDTVRFALADIEMKLFPSGRVHVDTGAYGKARALFDQGVLVATVENAERRFSRHWGESAPEKRKEVEALNRASVSEFGLSLEEIIAGLETLRASAAGDVAIQRLGEAKSAIGKERGWSETKIGRFLNLICTGERSDFLEPGLQYRQADVYPWRFNRRLSYLRKPCILRGDAGDEELIWGPRNVHRAGQYLVHICVSGRLEASSQEMKNLAAMCQRGETEEFTEDVAAVCRQEPGAVVEKGVKKVARLRIERNPGQSEGDIDVLAIFPRIRRVLVIETKALEVARTPLELKNEVILLLEGRKRTRSTIDKHTCRLRWVRQHLTAVLDHYRVAENRKKRWKVLAAIVVDREVLSGKLHSGEVPIMSLREFRDSWVRTV